MKNIYLLLYMAIFAILFSGCEKSENIQEVLDYSRGIYIVNEGSFQSNNGSISYFDPIEGIITNGIFEAANGRAVGDVVQSFAVAGDTTGYIVVNGSAKLEIVDLKTFKSIAEPIPVTYPRYFLQVNNETGYLTGGSMQGYVYLIDLKTHEKSDSIKVGYGPENMVLLHGLVYVANSGGWSVDSTISVIDATGHKVNDTIQVGKAPSDMVVDASGNLWVNCKGQAIYSWDPPYNLISETDALLQKIDITWGTIIWQAAVGRAGDYTATPPRIAASPDGEIIYYLRPDGVYKINSGSPEIPEVPLITGSFYGMDVNPDNGNIYVFESTFTGNGTMMLYDDSGNKLAEGMVGIAPNGAVFH
jgi:YVTN family beta-propeller protein